MTGGGKMYERRLLGWQEDTDFSLGWSTDLKI